MRKKFALFVLVPLILLLVVTALFIDRWVESGLELAGEEITGTRVEIDGCSLTLSPLGFRFDRLQVASAEDPWKNLFETGRVEFTMNLGQLIRGKVIVDSMVITDVILGTQRTTDGSIPGRSPRTGASQGGGFAPLVEEALQKTVTTTPLFDPALLRGSVNVDSLVKTQNFRSLALVDSLRRQTAAAAGVWDSTLASVEGGKKRLADVETRLKGINPSELKSVEKITEALATVNDAGAAVREVTTAFTERRAAITGSVQQLTASVGTIDEAVAGDIRQVISLARLPDVNAMGLAELFLGKKLLTDARRAAGWVDLARAQAERYAPKPAIESPPRLRGQDIRFPVERGVPEIWIRRATLSGGTDRKQNPDYVYLRGSVENISSDQRLAGEPLTVRLEGTKGNGLTLGFSALIDRRKEEPFDEYRLRMSGVPLAAFELGKSDFLPSTITHAVLAADVAVTIPGTSFNATSEFRFRSMTLAFHAEPRNLGERLARDILAGVNGFDAGFRIWKSGGGIDVAFTTDLDNQFADGVKRVIGAEVAKLQARVRDEVERKIAAKRKEFEAFYSAKRDDVEKKLNAYQALVNEKKGMAEGKKKELETRLEQQKKGAIDNLMKGIFKKN
jgi:uncharacterized protein (TIGR03545 family)